MDKDLYIEGKDANFTIFTKRLFKEIKKFYEDEENIKKYEEWLKTVKGG